MRPDTNIQGKNKRKKCCFVRENGQPCNSFASNNSEFCYMHDPNISEADKQEARIKGGKAKVLVINPAEIVTEIKLNTPKQVTKFYSQIINDVMKAKMDLRIATGIGYLLNGLLKSLELSEIEERLNKLETNFSNQTPINYE